MNSSNFKKNHSIQLIVGLLTIILIIYLASLFRFRIDLTSDKRFTLSKVSKELIKNIDQPVLIKVYLHGDIPVKFKNFSNQIKDLLDEIRIQANEQIHYEFIDPYAESTHLKTEDILKELTNQGLLPVNVQIKDKQGLTEKILVPGAIVACGGIEMPVNLLVKSKYLSGDQNLNSSVGMLEYNLVSAIWNVNKVEIDKIAFTEGHGELSETQTASITRELANFYQVDRGLINGNVDILRNYKVIIVARPQLPFNEADKYALDQYLMSGGSILWLIDPVKAELDSFQGNKQYAYIQELNLEDQLFRYGVRINPSLVQDIQCARIPVNISLQGSQPNFVPAPWLYSPLLNSNPEHPLSKNIDFVRADFISFIDTLSSFGTTKTPLLTTSQYSSIIKVPIVLSLEEVKQQLTRENFKQSSLMAAVLVEGNFSSVFQNRIVNHLQIKNSLRFIEKSKKARIVVVADGDLAKNNVRYSNQGIQIAPIGVDRFTGQTYGNKQFLLNTINYLADDIGLTTLRSKEIRDRMIDKSEILYNKLKWQIINTLIPLLILLIIGSLFIIHRNRYYRSI